MAASYLYPSQNWYTGFSLRKVFISGNAGTLNTGASSGASVTQWWRIPGILSMAATPGAKSVDQYGDDGLVNIWVYDARMSITLETSMAVPHIYAILTGNTASQVGGVDPTYIYYGSELEHTPPHIMIRAEATARLEGPNTPTSVNEFCRYTFFNCQMTNITGPETLAYGQVHSNRFNVEALPGYFDDLGVNLQNVAGPGATSAICKGEFGLAALDVNPRGF